MMRRIGIFVWLIALTTATAAAQQDAGIIGQVTDESGAVLPGVTISVTSPALQVPSVTSVSDERGEYRVTPLPIGTYAVEYTLSGFQTVRREGVRLTVGFTARVDISLKVGSLEETITVSGAAPVVDVSSTTATTQFTRETLEALPTSRNGIVSVLMQAPGVRGLRDVGGSSLNQVPTARAFGQAAEVYYTLEGVQTSSLQASGGQANYWDYTTVEEASVRTIGNSADMPYRGVALNAVVKSGSNDFHGSGWLNKTSASLQSKNIDDKLAAAGITSGGRLVERDSYSGELGGRIVRDKLWFYGGARRMTDVQEQLNVYMPDGTPAALDDGARTYTAKLSYQMSQSNRFVGFYQHYTKLQTNFLSQFRPWDQRGGINTYVDTGKVEWQKLFGSSLVTTLQYGRYTYVAHYWNVSNDVPTFDQVTLMENGPQDTSGQRPSAPRDHFKGTTTWFRPDLFKGNHELKFGFDYTDSWFGRQYPDLPADTVEGNGAYSSALYNYRLRFNNSLPFQLEVYNNPVLSNVIVKYLGLYAQDSWTIGRRVTLNLGVRYAHDNGYVPDSCHAAVPPGHVAFPQRCYEKKQFNIWNPVSPRMHAAWDITGDGKTMLKGGWGRFHHARQQDPELNAADPQIRTTVTYRWNDSNGNKLYDPGEVDLNPDGNDFVSQSAGTNTVASPDEREPVSDELSLTLERELMADFALRVSGIYSQYHDVYRRVNARRPYDAHNIPVTNPDPGPDGRVGSADDPGVNFTYWEFPSTLNGRAFELFMLTNDPNAEQKYKSVDLAVFKRLSNRWQLLVSYSATKTDNPFLNGRTAGSTNQNVFSADLNPNAEIFTADRTWEWTAKISGVYILPAQISVSAQLEHESGTPYAREVLFRGGRTIPSITLNVEPIGTRRLPHTNQLDLRVEKSFTVREGQRVAVRMNIFNALNSNAVLGVVRQSGATFDRPTSIMPPRIAEFSVSYTF
jgi:carboxypeptidase family protein/TonB-dependent receptor-like protein